MRSTVDLKHGGHVVYHDVCTCTSVFYESIFSTCFCWINCRIARVMLCVGVN